MADNQTGKIGGGLLAKLVAYGHQERPAQGDLVLRAGKPIEDVALIEEGLVSLFCVISSGLRVETTTLGPGAFLGSEVVLGASISNLDAAVTIPGKTMRIPTDIFLDAYLSQPALRKLVDQDILRRVFRTEQNLACQALHSIEQRLARWILMADDMSPGDEMPVGHGLLAEILGATRPTISVLAQRLRTAGLIRYSRAKMRVTDRAGLQRASCECYGRLKSDFSALAGGSDGLAKDRG